MPQSQENRILSLYKDIDGLLTAQRQAMQVRDCEEVISVAIATGHFLQGFASSSDNAALGEKLHRVCKDWLDLTDPILSDAYDHSGDGYAIERWDEFMRVHNRISDIVETEEREKARQMSLSTDELSALAQNFPSPAHW